MTRCGRHTAPAIESSPEQHQTAPADLTAARWDSLACKAQVKERLTR